MPPIKIAPWIVAGGVRGVAVYWTSEQAKADAEAARQQGKQPQISRGAPQWPPPAHQPACQCYPDLMKAFFCLQGHMTECHAGLSCTEAKCGHLPGYD